MLAPTQECTLPDGTLGRVSVGTYSNGRIAIVLECRFADGWERYTTLTTNLPEAYLEKDEVCIKNWSENEGLDKWAVEQGIIMPTPNRFRPSGFVQVPIYSITLAFYRQAFEAALAATEGLDND